MPLNTPILFLVYNRPEVTQRTLDAIRSAEPKTLYVSADGPNRAREGDEEKCGATRALIDGIDWECEVHRNFAAENLGCKRGVSSGLDWFFSQVREGIVLEDDCVPNLHFFHFCEELLERYRQDTRIMQICGSNFHTRWNCEPYSYFFSKYGPVWGWATWRRAWAYYDVDMKLWPIVKQREMHHAFCDSERELKWREDLFDKLHRGEIDTWDYQWVFAKLIQSGLCIVPRVNLISNIGHGPDATHTKGTGGAHSNLPRLPLDDELIHPPCVLRDVSADRAYLDNVLPKNRVRWYQRLRSKWIKR